MKTSREQLKALIKELLVEVLAEGLGQQVRPSVGTVGQQAVSETRRRTSAVNHSRPRQFDPNLDTPVVKLKDHIADAVRREAGGNPLMANILADTARTTLPTMMEHGRQDTGAGQHRIVQQEQINGTPEEVFGEEVASKWADLAFAQVPKRTA